MKREVTKEERQRRIELLSENKRSEAWQLIKERLQEWIDAENRYLDSFKQVRIAENQREEYNLHSELLRYLRGFLEINETLIAENKTLIERVVENTKTFWSNKDSFVKAKI